ncbi:MAG: 2-C-methyl-D-erythritol 2,4-cyclodiphosphate synthase [Dehalococcoidales bacterium]|nr:2-C-methyl-D-erythritol 2,4-cyclodiphosphate synthase [Dehalococcoidales bacterium]
MPRVGIGYDVHRLVQGRPLVLGGVPIAHPLGLEGHSDADVLVHAIMDAILGALALGDIGQHFPPDDPQYKDASSIGLLRRVRELVGARGWEVVNVDVSVAAEAPKLSPHNEQMRRTVADALGIAVDRVSIKATTNERLGFVGRREGIAALAVALLDRMAEGT